MVAQFSKKDKEIPNSAGPNHEINGFWPDENDSDASSESFLDVFGDDTPDGNFFEALNGETDEDHFAPSFP